MHQSFNKDYIEQMVLIFFEAYRESPFIYEPLKEVDYKPNSRMDPKL